MSVISDFWEEFGDQNFVFVDQESERHELTLLEAKNLLAKLSKQNLDSERNNSSFFDMIEGKIDSLLQEFGKSYFEPYKCCAYKAGFSYRNGDEAYRLICLFNHTTLIKNTDNLEEAYEYFKNETDRAGGLIKC